MTNRAVGCAALAMLVALVAACTTGERQGASAPGGGSTPSAASSSTRSSSRAGAPSATISTVSTNTVSTNTVSTSTVSTNTVSTSGPSTIVDAALSPGATRVRLVPLAAGATFGYLVGIPNSAAPAAGYPTIVFLHGFGERGNGTAAGLRVLENTGLPQLAARAQLPPTARGFLLLAPQTDAQSWRAGDVHEWIHQVEQSYPIDQHRLYLTGVSMGGGGVVGYLDTYGAAAGVAAAAPIAGDWAPAPAVTGLPSCPRLGGTPIWAFAGDIDDVVPHQLSINLVAYLRGHCAGAGKDRLTIYQGRFHDVWTDTYDLSGQADKTDARFDGYVPDLFTWFRRYRLD